MGNFYTNITVKGPTQQEVAKALAGRYDAVISASVGGCTVVYEKISDSQDGTVFKVAQELSEALGCAALGVMNHDDSVLLYQLWQAGQATDHYNSCPDYFDGLPTPPAGGDASVLCKAFGSLKIPEVTKILRALSSFQDELDHRYLLEVRRHRDLIVTLDLPTIAVGKGYNYLAQDEFPAGFDPDAICRTTAN